MVYRINFFDVNTGMDKWANMHWPTPEVEYIKPPILEYDGISVFTDEMCFDPIVDQVKSKYKIAWAFESPVVKPHVYQNISLVEHKFDKIYICNPDHNNPKHVQSYFGACWVPESHCKIYEKTKLLSIVASNKNWAPGHQFRHVIIQSNPHPELELWGSGYRWFDDTPDGRVLPFKDYRYCIVVENCKYPGYFTDKIIDCFATGVIPIYCGNPNMDRLFDSRGFYTFSTLPQLNEVLSKISIDDYNSKKSFILENYYRFKEYASPDMWMIRNCYNKLV